MATANTADQKALICRGRVESPNVTDVLWSFICGSNVYSPGIEVLSQGRPNLIGLQLPKHIFIKLGICD